MVRASASFASASSVAESTCTNAALVGANTVVQDNPSLTTREVEGSNPTRIVIDLKNSLEETYQVFNSEAKTIRLTADTIDLQKPLASEVCKVLHSHQINSVIVEGGQKTLQAFIDSVSHMDILSIGLNCSLGAEELEPYVTELSQKAPFYISTHPNAGLPNQFGEYDQTPEQMSELISKWLDEGKVNILGGCCGTTPEHIKAIADLASNYSPKNN